MPNKKVLTYSQLRSKLKLKPVDLDVGEVPTPQKKVTQAASREAAELLASLPLPSKSDYLKPSSIELSYVTEPLPSKHLKIEKPTTPAQKSEFVEVSQNDLLDEEWQDKYRLQQEMEQIKKLERSKLTVSERQRKMNHLVALAEEVIDRQEEYDARFQESLTSRKQASEKYGW
mmetsp:Transcript_5897/g.10496  ORF Transcript_5897/g.10496 Transcript_5897/m.10496 type:complete len:173 (+) Transcript_5897:109-627(+)